MRMITQYYEPDTGTIALDGVPLADAARAAKRHIGYLPENNPLYEDMLVHDYLAFIADLRELAACPRQALEAAVSAPASRPSTTADFRAVEGISPAGRSRAGDPAPPRPPGARRANGGLDPTSASRSAA